MKCKTILCTLITVYVASFSSLSAENKNRFSAGIGSSSGYAFLETLFFPSPGITIDSPNENIEGRIEDDTDFKSGLNLYNVSYDRMVFKHLALGFVYNYENINYIINYENMILLRLILRFTA
ncbi:MAG TPA: hypothetical protein P5123_09725 [Spirochaetota bacterium]|nr:hypothetical protein [Spirochaetota bacterium]